MQGTIQRHVSLPLPMVNPRVVAACRTSNPAFGQPRWVHGDYGGPSFARPAAPVSSKGTEATAPEKAAEATKAPERSAATVEAEPKTSAETASAISGEKPAEGPPPVRMSKSGPSPPPPPPHSATSSLRSPTPPFAEAAAPGDPTQTAHFESPNISAGTTRFGIEIGTVEKKDGLRPLWHDFLTRQVALVAGLQARGMFAPDKKWRLIAGPFGSLGEATQACAPFKKANLKCEATAFGGDQL